MSGIGGVALLLPWALVPGAVLTLVAGAIGHRRFGRGHVTWTSTLAGMVTALVALGVAWSLAPALARRESDLAALLLLAGASGVAAAAVLAARRAGTGPAVTAGAATLVFLVLVSPWVDFVTSCLTGVSFFMGSQC